MIEVTGLTKKFAGRTVLDSLDFSVRQGEILGLLGPNGAGKTTTMKILTGFWPATAGQVTIAGKDIDHDALNIKKHLGYLPEHVPLYEDMKVYEYLRFVAEVREIEKDDIISRIKEVSAQCGLQKVIGQTIGELSKGYRQRVGLAQAIMHNPDILILDEPTTGLDPNQIVEIRELIKNIGQQKTIIFSTHILAEASATCDRVLIMNQGKIVGEGTPAELTAKLTGSASLQVKVRGPQSAVLSALQSLAPLATVAVVAVESADVVTYAITTQPEQEVREDLAKLIVNNNWGLLELNQTQASLEDVFRQLTK